MYSRPDPATADRMTDGFTRAVSALDLRIDHEPAFWGWRGRTLSGPVTGAHGPGWLRLVCAVQDKAYDRLWLGPESAQQALPASVPRPALRAIHDWGNSEYAYRAELHDRVTAQPVTTHGPVLRSDPELSPTWWAGLTDALIGVAKTPTDRIVVRQEYLHRAMPQFLPLPPGAAFDATVPRWETAHGDLHWANLTAPELLILDWEGWGKAPAGFDAAMLHTYSLLVPTVTARIQEQLGETLDTPEGRFAELAVITMLLQTNTRGDNLELADALHVRANHLLSR